MVFSVVLMLWSFGGLTVDADELGIYQNMLFQKTDFGYVVSTVPASKTPSPTPKTPTATEFVKESRTNSKRK